ncbi:MAG: alpha/beta hydrolase [Flavobacteriales bacterium]|nr:alpha/beta hydrolase [Flavobacteriales bacterium]
MTDNESIYLKLSRTDILHVKRWYTDRNGPAVLLIHGSIENGRIFYSENGKGLAPYLAELGYDVFVPDLRGRGKSTPAIGRHSDFGQMDMVNTDIPFLIESVKEIKQTRTMWIGAHSWGGNLALASYARFPEVADIAGFILFGVKRRVTVWNMERILKMNIGWRTMAPVAIAIKGYLPAKDLKMGADNETRGMVRDTNFWMDSSLWTDSRDGFDYGSALKKVVVPPVLSLTGAGDRVLGHPRDCGEMLNLLNTTDGTFRSIGKATGHRHDYDHIDLVTHKDAGKDHFPMIAEWMSARS